MLLAFYIHLIYSFCTWYSQPCTEGCSLYYDLAASVTFCVCMCVGYLDQRVKCFSDDLGIVVYLVSQLTIQGLALLFYLHIIGELTLDIESFLAYWIFLKNNNIF